MITTWRTMVSEVVHSSNSVDDNSNNARDFSETASRGYVAMTTTTSMAYLPQAQTLVLCEFRHDGFEECVPSGPSDSGLVSKWRPRDRFASGKISSITAWDLDKEQLVSSIPSTSDSSISALAVSQVHGGQFAAGFVDGFVRLYDIRTPEMLVSETQPHTQRSERVVGMGFQPGLDPAKLVSASQAGNIQFLDMRAAEKTLLTIEAHRGSLTALAVHRHAPLVASGSAKQCIKIFNLTGDPLGTIRYHPTGSFSCLIFHAYQVLLAAGAVDSRVSIYADEISPPR